MRSGCLALLLVSLLTGCRATPWVESSPDGKFTILTPGPLTEENPPEKGRADHVYSYTQRHGKYMVYLTEAADVADEQAIRDQLKTIAEELATKLETKLRYVYPMVLDGGYHAVDFEADRIERKQTLRVRIIYAKSRVYRLILSGDRSWMSMAEVNKFFQSFKLL